MKLTKKKAKKLSIKKWKYIVNNNGSEMGLIEKHPELKNLVNKCGYCQYSENRNDYYCLKCPLLVGDKGCPDEGHVWNNWNENKTKSNAQAMLDLILKS